MFDIFVTINDHSMIFFFIFPVLTFDDFVKVKQGHSQMGSIIIVWLRNPESFMLLPYYAQ